jgi:hypothetical protein|tara:strand:+ start:138 stop:380 length:243 start_codon:yes stop_codon:yes gene_type:complete
MKYNKLFNLIKNECEEIYFPIECENFLEENELDLKWFKENDMIIFSNICTNYNNVIKILNDNKIKFNEYEDYLNLKYIVI